MLFQDFKFMQNSEPQQFSLNIIFANLWCEIWLYLCFIKCLKVAPYNLSKEKNGTLVYNIIFHKIYDILDESKQIIMINQRLEFTKRQRTIFKLTLL